MQRLEVSGAVRPIYWSLGVKRLSTRNYAVSIYAAQSMDCGQPFAKMVMKILVV